MIKPPFRIAMRDEGEWIRVYFADPHTMEGSVEILAIRKTFLDVDHPALRDRLLELVQEGLAKICEDEGLGRPSDWIRQKAPGHERRQ